MHQKRPGDNGKLHRHPVCLGTTVSVFSTNCGTTRSLAVNQGGVRPVRCALQGDACAACRQPVGKRGARARAPVTGSASDGTPGVRGRARLSEHLPFPHAGGRLPAMAVTPTFPSRSPAITISLPRPLRSVVRGGSAPSLPDASKPVRSGDCHRQGLSVGIFGRDASRAQPNPSTDTSSTIESYTGGETTSRRIWFEYIALIPLRHRGMTIQLEGQVAA